MWTGVALWISSLSNVLLPILIRSLIISNPYMDYLVASLNEHSDLLFHLFPLREASKSFEILTFLRSALASFSGRHSPVAISSFKTLTDIAEPRLARHVHHLISDFHSGKAIPQTIPHVKLLLSGTAFQHTPDDSSFVFEIFGKARYLKNVLPKRPYLKHLSGNSRVSK